MAFRLRPSNAPLTDPRVVYSFAFRVAQPIMSGPNLSGDECGSGLRARVQEVIDTDWGRRQVRRDLNVRWPMVGTYSVEPITGGCRFSVQIEFFGWPPDRQDSLSREGEAELANYLATTKAILEQDQACRSE